MVLIHQRDQVKRKEDRIIEMKVHTSDAYAYV